jgi:hypothetical protein
MQTNISRRLVEYVLAIALLALCALPAQAQRQCTKITPFQHTTPTGPVWLVPGVQDQRVYYCGFMLAQKGNTLDFKIWFAPDAGCGEQGTLGPTWSLPTDMAIVNRTAGLHRTRDAALGRSPEPRPR